MHSKTVLIMLVIIASAAGSALGATPGQSLPSGAEVAATFELVGDDWVPATHAMSWNSGEASSGGMNNGEIHSFDIVNHVSVAQWVEWSISATRKDWRVLRPGTYASGGVDFTIRSNNAIDLAFYTTDPEYLSAGGVTRTIPKWFSFSPDAHSTANDVADNSWIAASSTSASEPHSLTLPDNAALHSGFTYHVWEKIEVVPSNSSSDYEGTGNVTISLTNVKHWVDPEAGNFKPGGLGHLDGPW